MKGQISRKGRDLHDDRLGGRGGESQNLRAPSRMNKENGDTDDMNNTKDSKDSKGAKDIRDTRDTQDSLPESPSYLLDTSAILAFYQDEPGASTIEDLFEKREKGLLRIYVSFISLFEILYLTISREGSEKAFSLLFQVRNLQMDEVWPDEELLWKAAEIKARGGLSVADALIAASALAKEAILLHKDSEFHSLEPNVRTLCLEG